MKKNNGRFQTLVLAIFSIAFLALGCASGGGGVVGTAPKLDQDLQSAWQYVRVGDNNNAIIAFRNVLEQTPNKSEETSAHTGIAWAYAQLNDTDKACAYFEKVKSTSNDANLGYAGVLISRGKEGDYKNAVSLLEAININNLDQAYVSEYTLDISSAQAHALMGIAYYYTGNNKNAKAQIEKAKSTDVTDGTSAVSNIANAILNDLKLEGY
ncbi:MAG TPA: tetratricopeptide repeat protein [Candidatus Wallbacteria bacterium]|nr:tetratricopeptide repeat protein [Candidatus Wallbacteria bacterium]